MVPLNVLIVDHWCLRDGDCLSGHDVGMRDDDRQGLANRSLPYPARYNAHNHQDDYCGRNEEGRESCEYSKKKKDFIFTDGKVLTDNSKNKTFIFSLVRNIQINAMLLKTYQ